MGAEKIQTITITRRVPAHWKDEATVCIAKARLADIGAKDIEAVVSSVPVVGPVTVELDREDAEMVVRACSGTAVGALERVLVAVRRALREATE